MAFLTYDEVKARLQKFIHKPGRSVQWSKEVYSLELYSPVTFAEIEEIWSFTSSPVTTFLCQDWCLFIRGIDLFRYYDLINAFKPLKNWAYMSFGFGLKPLKNLLLMVLLIFVSVLSFHPNASVYIKDFVSLCSQLHFPAELYSSGSVGYWVCHCWWEHSPDNPSQ